MENLGGAAGLSEKITGLVVLFNVQEKSYKLSPNVS